LRGRTGCFHNGPGWSAPPRSSFRRTARQLLTEVEKKFAEATARAIAEIRLPIMGVLLFPEGDCSTAPPFLLPATRYPAAGGPRGDDASVRARHQNKILVRSSRGLRRDFHSADDLAEFASSCRERRSAGERRGEPERGPVTACNFNLWPGKQVPQPGTKRHTRPAGKSESARLLRRARR